MIGKDELAEAARYNDAEVEGDAESFARFFTSRNIDLEGMVYVAQQRALRAVMTSFMGVDPSELNQPLNAPHRVVDMPDHLRALLPILTASVIDGVAMMARTREIRDQTTVTEEMPYSVSEVMDVHGTLREYGVLLGRFTREDDAVAFIDTRPKVRREAGHYSLDGPDRQ